MNGTIGFTIVKCINKLPTDDFVAVKNLEKLVMHHYEPRVNNLEKISSLSGKYLIFRKTQKYVEEMT